MKNIREKLSLVAQTPSDFTGLPTSDPRSPLLFPYRSTRQPDDIPILWRLTHEAVAGTLQPDTFNRALEIGNVGLSKLTMGLFWINADLYLALNSKNVAYLSELGFPDAAEIVSLETYQATIERARTFAPSFTALSHAAWVSGGPVLPPDRFPLQELQETTASSRAEFSRLTDLGDVQAAKPFMQQTQAKLHNRFGSLLKATVRQSQPKALVVREDTRYTGGKIFAVRVAFQDRSRSGGKGLYFGNLVISVESDSETQANTLMALFGLAHGVDSMGRDTVRLALQKPAAMERVLSALRAVYDLPTSPQLTIVKEVWSGPDFTLTGRADPELEKALHTYAVSVGKPRKLEVLVRVPAEALISAEYPDTMAAVIGYLDGLAAAIDEVVRDMENDDAIEVQPVVPLTVQPQPLHPLNVILYGPPGTGKTYSVARLALERLDPDFLSGERTRQELQDRLTQLQAEGRAVFTTFHQNYAYEDFIEGIKPVPAPDGSGGVTYALVPGILKRLVERASAPVLSGAFSDLNPDGQVWKISLDGTAGSSSTREYCLKHGEARIGYEQVGRFDEAVTLSGAPKAFYEGMEVGDLLLMSAPHTHVQAVGIVTGDYRYEEQVPQGVKADYRNVRAVTWMESSLSLPVKEFIGRNFSQISVYHLDLHVPEVMAFLERAGVLKSAMMTTELPQAHVLIIDEINRGNVAKIFGELITLLEPSKRLGREEATTVELPYSKKPFALPSNVYVIGTMNTADQSLARLDSALRRRFEFVEMFPRPESLVVTADGIDLRRVLYAMNRRLTLLQGRDYTIGHAYFTHLEKSATVTDVARVFRLKVLPLLEEYFFDDWGQIRAVLNDVAKPQEDQLIVPEDAGAWLENWDTPGEVYRVQEAALARVGAFTGIYKGSLTFPFDVSVTPAP
ncbi:AAA family ATPase [Deinococcus psychrotolerans]|uniref:AAA family ATPase n=1 Tax=Deinococcus psychrotolerans TaxID=2489213 RepID=UPI0013DDABC2|nr:AAA family ATPase [Deinococcus psychrotolerans]